jgi:DNA-binding NarL/FixJ family response regulator
LSNTDTSSSDTTAARNIINLTAREREVVKLVTGGLSNKEVGRALNLAEGTVKIHLHNIYEKLGVPNRTALVAFAFYEQMRVSEGMSRPMLK